MKITIEGMMCQHCRKRVEDVLNAVPGVQATVDLDQKQATVVTDTVSADELTAVITQAGYTVTAVETN